MTERPAAPAETDDIERHPDYLPEPDFFDEGDDDGAEDQAPDPADDDDGAG
jgi:hypothetical protein